MPTECGEVTALLDSLRAQAPDAESRLIKLVYAKLRKMARYHLQHERSDLTLQATDLVHEAYIRMAGDQADCENQAHFFGIAARAMRQVLVDHARSHRAEKRGSGKAKISLDDTLFVPIAQPEHLLEIDDALGKLALLDPRQARVVELRFFAGLSVEETAQVIGCSDRNVKREWRIARAWLHRELTR
jgi:RNA polymerase sigma factor (TIGR02999 family)